MCASDDFLLEWGISLPYPFDRVQKVVHLIRDPYDNIVSRFNHEIKSGHTKSQEFGAEAFRAHCQQEFKTSVSKRRTLEMFLSEYQYSKFQDIPCLDEFVKYALWHNHAFETSATLGLDTMLVHYSSWYATTFQATKNKLLAFLGLKEHAESPVEHPFVTGQVYSGYFTEQERKDVQSILMSLASEETWAEIRQYFASE
jgi:hypothetical protein